jgi:hypothetical protein
MIDIKIPYDAGDPEQVKEKKTKHKLKSEQHLEELKELLSKRQFRSYIWRTLERTKAFHTFSHLDPQPMAIASGKRDIGLEIIADIEAAQIDILGIMKKEKDDY